MCHFSDTSWKRTVHSYLLVVRSSNKRTFITLPINAVYIVDMFDQLSKGSQWSCKNQCCHHQPTQYDSGQSGIWGHSKTVEEGGNHWSWLGCSLFWKLNFNFPVKFSLLSKYFFQSEKKENQAPFFTWQFSFKGQHADRFATLWYNYETSSKINNLEIF